MKGVIGILNNGVNIQFGVHLPDTDKVKIQKFPLIRGSNTNEKGAYLTFVEEDYTQAQIEYMSLTDKIILHVTEVKTSPLLKVYCKLPTPQDLNISEFSVEGYFDISKIDIPNKSKTILGEDILKKMKENKKLSIDSKVYIEVIGPALEREQILETEYGEVRRIRNSLNVEI